MAKRGDDGSWRSNRAEEKRGPVPRPRSAVVEVCRDVCYVFVLRVFCSADVALVVLGETFKCTFFVYLVLGARGVARQEPENRVWLNS